MDISNKELGNTADNLRMEQRRLIKMIKEQFAEKYTDFEAIWKNIRYIPKTVSRKYKVIVLEYHTPNASVEESFIYNLFIALKLIGCEPVFMTQMDLAYAIDTWEKSPTSQDTVLCDFIVNFHFTCIDDPVYDRLGIPFISVILDRAYFSIVHNNNGPTFNIIKHHNEIKHAIYAWSDRTDLRYADMYFKNGMHGFLPHCAELDYDSGDIFKQERCIDVVVSCSSHLSKSLDTYIDNLSKSDNKYDNKLADLISRILEYYTNDGKDKTLEECVKDITGCSDGDLVGFMSNWFCSNMNQRARHEKRHRLMKALLDGGITVHLFGRWESAEIVEHPNCAYHGVIECDPGRKIFEHCKILINIMPSYCMDGAHDRIFSSMSRGALCMTDATDYLREIFTDGKDIVFYDNNDLDSLIDKIKYYLAHDEDRIQITKNAFENVRLNHTWINRAESIVSMYEDFRRKYPL